MQIKFFSACAFYWLFFSLSCIIETWYTDTQSPLFRYDISVLIMLFGQLPCWDFQSGELLYISSGQMVNYKTGGGEKSQISVNFITQLHRLPPQYHPSWYAKLVFLARWLVDMCIKLLVTWLISIRLHHSLNRPIGHASQAVCF